MTQIPQNRPTTLTIAMIFLMTSLQPVAHAGSIYDRNQAQSLATAPKFIEVTSEELDTGVRSGVIHLQLIDRSEPSRPQVVQSKSVSEEMLLTMAVLESIERSRIFADFGQEKASAGRGENRGANNPDKGISDFFVTSSILLPFMALFLPIGPAAAIPTVLAGLYLGIKSLFQSLGASEKKSELDQQLTAGSASLLLEARENEAVPASSWDRRDILVKIMSNLDTLSDRYEDTKALALRRLNQETPLRMTEITEAELTDFSHILTMWKTALLQQASELEKKQLREFDKLISTRLVQHQLELVELHLRRVSLLNAVIADSAARNADQVAMARLESYQDQLDSLRVFVNSAEVLKAAKIN